jgi:hypothetical protein
VIVDNVTERAVHIDGDTEVEEDVLQCENEGLGFFVREGIRVIGMHGNCSSRTRSPRASPPRLSFCVAVEEAELLGQELVDALVGRLPPVQEVTTTTSCFWP